MARSHRRHERERDDGSRRGASRPRPARPSERLVGDADLRDERGHALRCADRQLVLPALPGGSLAAAGHRGEGPRHPADPRRRPPHDERLDAPRLARGLCRAAPQRARARPARARRPVRLLRLRGARLPDRPDEVHAAAERVRLHLLHAPRRRPRARRPRDAAQPLARLPPRAWADELPARRPPGAHALLARRQRRPPRRDRHDPLRQRMTRRLEALQWFGLFGGAFAWAAQFVVGYGIAQAECSVGGGRLGIDPKPWQAAAFASAALVTVLAEVAAIAVVRATSDTGYDGTPPAGR